MNHRQYNRRQFIGTTALGAAMTVGASFWGARPILAQAPNIAPLGDPEKDRYFIICYFKGGWDTLLSLDPRDPQLFTDQAVAETRIQPGYNRLTSTFQGDAVYLGNRMDHAGHANRTALGAYMGELADEPYRSQIAVVRGLNMSTLSHDVGPVRARTGRPPSGNNPRGSSAATWLARHYAMGHEVAPNFSIGEPVYNQDHPVGYDPMVSRGNLVGILQPAQFVSRMGAPNRDIIDDFLAREYPCAEAGESAYMETARVGRINASSLLSQNIAGAFDFTANNQAMSDIRDHFGFQAQDKNTPEVRAATAVRALTTGFARVVSLPLYGADPHFGSEWRTIAGENQLKSFNIVARMMDALEATPMGDGSGESFLDRTTIVMYSDFARSTILNRMGGRDHWLISSMFLAGADINGGTVVGFSTNVGMRAGLVDTTTGASDPVNGVELRPAHVWQSLFYAGGFDMNADIADMRVNPLLPLIRNS